MDDRLGNLHSNGDNATSINLHNDVQNSDARTTEISDDDRLSMEDKQNILRQRLKTMLTSVEDSEMNKDNDMNGQRKAVDDDPENDWDEHLNFDGIAEDGETYKIRLNLLEEILLLGLKEKEGYTSFWNDNISTGLRGAILVELSLLKRIRLDKPKARRRSLTYRKVICLDSSSTGDALLDEALKHIKEHNNLYSVSAWIDFLSGDTWNPINFRFHMRNLRERLAKSLVDKGICSTRKQNLLLFDMTTHPLTNTTLKSVLIKRVQSLLLTAWRSDLTRFRSKRSLALLYLAQASDVLDNALASLNYMDFDLASKHLRGLLAVDPESESQKHEVRMEILWAVVSTFLK